MEFESSNFYYFFIGKTSSIDDYEKKDVFNMLDHLSANMIYTVIETWRPKVQWNMIISAGEPEHF